MFKHCLFRAAAAVVAAVDFDVVFVAVDVAAEVDVDVVYVVDVSACPAKAVDISAALAFLVNSLLTSVCV